MLWGLRCRWAAGLTAGVLAIAGSLFESRLRADDPLPPVAATAAVVPSVDERLRELEEQHSTLLHQNRRLSFEVEKLRSASHENGALGPLDSVPGPATSAMSSPGYAAPSRFLADYDEGFVLVPRDPESIPFSLKFNNQTQFRYTGFVRDVKTWTDSAGNVNPVTNRSNFEIPRGRAIVSGMALLPELRYWLSIDYNTVSSNPVGFRGYSLSYRFDRAFEIHVGQNKVPGSRQWLVSSMAQQGPDRTLATTFFRPSLSQGIWFTGEPLDGLHYYTMLSNGFNTLNTPPSQLDNRMAWSGSVWWEPWGEFGETDADLECHDDPVMRLGTSFTYANEQGQQGDPNSPENSEIRLTDGTVITTTGAFAPGVTLQRYQIGLAAFDFALKHLGWSLSTEFFLQELFGLVGDSPLPLNSTFAFGGFVQAGYFLLPGEVEVYGRTSHVSGEYGTGGEYAGGFNWYILPGKTNLRFTVDVAWINRSPAQQNRTDYRAGDTGLLLRTQIQAFF